MGTADLGYWSRKGCPFVMPIRPVAGLPDVSVITAIHPEIMRVIIRKHKLFTAQYAAIEATIRRVQSASYGGFGPVSGIARLAFMTRIEVPNSPAKRRTSGRVGRWLMILLLIVVVGAGLWTWLTLG